MWIIAAIFYVATNITWYGVSQHKVQEAREEARYQAQANTRVDQVAKAD